MTTEQPARRPPDFRGPFGYAWHVPQTNPPHPTTVAQWVISAPNSHPLWPWVLVTVVHLRDVEGVPPAEVRLEWATHELSVLALDPDYYPPNVDSQDQHVLKPANFIAQFGATSDQAAIDAVVEYAIEPIVRGKLNPDSDGAQGWIAVWGDNALIRDGFNGLFLPPPQ